MLPIVLSSRGSPEDSKNSKTGNIVQTWILREDVNPQRAVETGLDSQSAGTAGRGRPPAGIASVGGTCTPGRLEGPGRPTDTRSSTWRTCPRSTVACWRIGSYGDPLSVPYGLWPAFWPWASLRVVGILASMAPSSGSPIPDFLMASVDSADDFLEASPGRLEVFPDAPEDGAGTSRGNRLPGLEGSRPPDAVFHLPCLRRPAGASGHRASRVPQSRRELKGRVDLKTSKRPRLHRRMSTVSASSGPSSRGAPRWAVGRAITCPGCGAILDCRRAIWPIPVPDPPCLRGVLGQSEGLRLARGGPMWKVTDGRNWEPVTRTRELAGKRQKIGELEPWSLSFPAGLP